MTQSEARERVARGAALLDEKRPGWPSHIRVNDLRMSSCSTCVIGQLEGDFDEGWRLLAEDGNSRRYSWLQKAQLYGFDSDGSEDAFTLLQAAWLEAIAERLNTPTVVQDAPQVAWTMREKVGA